MTAAALDARRPAGFTLRLRRVDRRAIIAVAILAVLAGLAFASPYLFADPVRQDAPGRLLAPSLDHPFGTDELRRDLLARTFAGLRASLIVAFSSVPLGAAAGVAVGFTAGYAGGLTDALLMRLIDAWLAFPGLLAALAILTILGPGNESIIVALAIFNVPVFARLSRAQVLSERNRDYVVAARALGAGPIRIVVRHIAVNALAPLVTQVAIALPISILIAAGLSFLGLGERPPAPSLGGLINAARPYLRDAWWYTAFPAAVLGLLLLALTLLADAISDAVAGRGQG